MRRVTIFISLLLFAVATKAQTVEDIVEAYRQGLLSESQIEQLKQQYIGGDVAAETVTQQPSRKREVVKNIRVDSLRGDSASVVQVSAVHPNACRSDIFGHDLFRGGSNGFEPNLNIATPEDYRLGAGDEVIVDLWGDVQRSYQLEISPDGLVIVPDVGPIMVAGLSIKDAARRVRRALSSIYEGLTQGSVDLMLSLGRIRTIRVNLAGEVAMPGAYTLPSLATLMHALYVSGGVSDIGSLRNVKLYRGGRLVASADLYDYLLNGNSVDNLSLQDGDLIVVPTCESLVKIEGQVRRPMFYEVQVGESLADLIRFAGGFVGGADHNRVMVVRRTAGKHQSFMVNRNSLEDFDLTDGDKISIGGGINRYENRVEVRGAVNREGFYAIDEQVRTLRQLLQRAGGLREDAFMSRALLYREGEDLTPEVVAIDLQGLMSGEQEDLVLLPNDILAVSTIGDLREEYQVGIFGAVGHSGEYPYAENMTVEDLIVAAGGLLESASTTNVTITRRIKQPRSRNVQEQLFEIFVVDISEGLEIHSGEFRLQPFDQVFVRRSPVYITQSSVEVRGEVAFEGSYPLMRRNMRLSEIVAEAGYPTSGAFIEGAYLLRRMTDEEQAQQDILKSLIDNQKGRGTIDSLEMAGIDLSSVYPVGINLAEALNHPGSDADVVLRNGDVISIPLYNGTVRVMGSVMYPNSITYKEGRSLKYYIKAAGGYDNRARKSRTFVIYMNGMVESGTTTRIRPGCIIIVPSKLPVPPMRWSDIIGLLSSSASTAAVVMSAINLAN